MAATGFSKLGPNSKNYIPADQGAYYTFTNPTAGTGLISGVVTSLADTTPLLVVKNNNPVNSGINVYLDHLKLVVSVVGVGHTAPFVALKIDRAQNTRYTSGGTQLTPQNSAANSPNQSGNTQVFFGAITAGAAGSAALLASHRIKGAIEVALDSFMLDFGAPEQQPQNGLVDNSTTISHGYFTMPAVVLGPQQHALLHYFAASLGTGTTFFVNGAYWEV